MLSITGAEAATIPYRVTATGARLTLAGGTATLGTALELSAAPTVPKLNRMHMRESLTGPGGQPSHRLMAIWQDSMDKIEESFEALTNQVTDLEAIVRQIQAAMDAATAAQAKADEVDARVSLADSYTDPVSVLTAESDGSIAIAAHTRIYGNGTSVSVNSGALSGFAQGAYVGVYYQDAARDGGAVTYQGTTNAVAQEGARHVVGFVTIPASGEPPADGGGGGGPGYTPPPGGGGGGTYEP